MVERNEKYIQKVTSFKKSGLKRIFFILHNGKPICFLSNKSISVIKEFNIKRHYSTKHPTLHSQTGQIKKKQIQKLTAKLEMQQQIFHTQRTQYDNVVRASFIFSSKLEKSLKLFVEGEFINECMLKVYNVFCFVKKYEFEKIRLSSRIIVRRIKMMDCDKKTTLTDRMTGFESCTVALDQSTDLSDSSPRYIYSRC